MGVEAAVMLLVVILSKRDIETTGKQSIKLIKRGNFKGMTLLLSVTEWQELGNTMWERTITDDAKEKKEIKTVRELCRTITETLKAMKAEREVACAAAQMMGTGAEPPPEKKPEPRHRILG